MAPAIALTIAWLAAPVFAGLRTELIVDGLDSPVFVTAPAGDERLFIVERRGIVRILEAGQLLTEPFLDMRDDVTVEGAFGMFGLAFAPDYPTSGLFFVYAIDPGWDSVIARYRVGADPNVADPSSRQVVFRLAQTWRDHNGGTVAFHPLDDTLYFAPGDGGGGPKDPDETAQNPLNRLGKMLRFDVGGAGATAVTAPVDNPFVGNPAVDDFIWALGLRNPFRFSFDRLTGELWIADVGQEGYEEILVEPASHAGGLNYGWDVMEGPVCNPNDPASFPPCNDPVFEPALYEYDHAQGDCSVTGGYVYRGSIPELYGEYVFGDYCSGRVWSLERDPLTTVDRTAELEPPGPESLGDIVGFGEDGFGELYIVSLAGQVYRLRSTEEDADDDVAPDGSDCAPLDAALWSVPGETRRLVVGETSIDWDAPVLLGGRAALQYELLVSATAHGFGTPSCVTLANAATPSAVDPVDPARGALRFYLARAVNGCGAGAAGRPAGDCP